MGANIKAIRARIKSVDSTRHITKAMELVASSKIRKASERMEHSRFYKKVMLDAFASLAGEKSQYSVIRSKGIPALYIIVAGDRGLAGGYNNNIFRSAFTELHPGDYVIPVGKRAVDHYRGHNELKIVSDEFLSVEYFDSLSSAKIAYMVKDLYDEGKIGSVRLISTHFESMLSQTPELIRLLPLEDLAVAHNVATDKKTVTEYEPSAEEVLAALIPEYISGVLSTSVAEAYAAELAARRSAMDTATKNADEMLDELNLNYNRARQSAITQEITEIVAGANA